MSGTTDESLVTELLPAMEMPRLTSMSVSFAVRKETIYELLRIFLSCSRSYPTLQKFALDFTDSPYPPVGNVLESLWLNFASLQEITLKGPGLCLFSECHLTTPIAWQVVRLRGFDHQSYETVCEMAATEPQWGSCKIDIVDERNVSTEILHLLGDKLVYERKPDRLLEYVAIGDNSGEDDRSYPFSS
ncbi:hypothetical protein BD410DRAFT_780656 [Rickenella mellea]|uniref:F-box domain-containing protein n=1 Tax=Rickenella mellea TaxID=50990 RepID=A0A4R5XI15_9AGAM|nr:hypothetical protein BD410DRAFT_780656 [Rickenella mellea]